MVTIVDTFEYLGEELRDSADRYDKVETEEDLMNDVIYRTIHLVSNLLLYAEEFELKVLAMGGIREYSNKCSIEIPSELKMNDERIEEVSQLINKTISKWAADRKLTGTSQIDYDGAEHMLKITVKITW